MLYSQRYGLSLYSAAAAQKYENSSMVIDDLLKIIENAILIKSKCIHS